MATGDEELRAEPAAMSAPDGIEFRHLRAFIAVAEELNFGRASARLFISQPALSRQIAALERRVGCELVRRSTHKVELTLAGAAMLERSLRLIRELDATVAATRAVGGVIDAEVARLWDGASDVLVQGAALEEVRTACEDFHAQFPLPDGTVVRPVNAGGVPALMVATATRQRPTVLYLHGGGYVMGSAFGYRHMAAAVATACDRAVLVPDYRLAPEHPYPAAVEDAELAYRWLLDNDTHAGEVFVAGDSSGAGLAISLLLSLRRHQLPQPAAAALLCPVVDLTFDVVGAAAAAQPTLDVDQLRSFASWYLADADDDEFIDPLSADLGGLPPLLIQAGEADAISTDASRLADAARACSVTVELQWYPVDTHDFHVFWSLLPAAADAMNSVGAFATSTIAAGNKLPAGPT